MKDRSLKELCQDADKEWESSNPKPLNEVTNVDQLHKLIKYLYHWGMGSKNLAPQLRTLYIRRRVRTDRDGEFWVNKFNG